MLKTLIKNFPESELLALFEYFIELFYIVLNERMCISTEYGK